MLVDGWIDTVSCLFQETLPSSLKENHRTIAPLLLAAYAEKTTVPAANQRWSHLAQTAAVRRSTAGTSTTRSGSATKSGSFLHHSYRVRDVTISVVCGSAGSTLFCCFDADSDLDPTFHFDADPDPGSAPTPSFKNVVRKDFFILLFTAVSVTLFFLSRHCHRCHIFNSLLKIFWKKYTGS